jgi:hypothetical protein
MDLKKLLIAFVAGFVVMFLLAGLWHMVIMSDFYFSSDLNLREQPLMGYITLGYLVLALLMAYVYPKGYAGGAPVKEGLKFGVLFGLIWILPHSLALFGFSSATTGVQLIVDAIWHLVEQGSGGIVIALVYGKPA